jgi:hypothetical protein
VRGRRSAGGGAEPLPPGSEVGAAAPASARARRSAPLHRRFRRVHVRGAHARTCYGLPVRCAVEHGSPCRRSSLACVKPAPRAPGRGGRSPLYPVRRALPRAYRRTAYWIAAARGGGRAGRRVRRHLRAREHGGGDRLPRACCGFIGGRGGGGIFAGGQRASGRRQPGLLRATQRAPPQAAVHRGAGARRHHSAPRRPHTFRLCGRGARRERTLVVSGSVSRSMPLRRTAVPRCPPANAPRP